MSTNVHSSEAAAPFRGRLAVAATLSFAAGVVHAAAAVPHFGDDMLLGSAFAITGWLQIIVAALLLRRRPARGTVWVGVAVHVGALGALVAARTIGLPIGHGGVEPVTLPDATTAVLEVAALAVLVGWLRRPHRLGASRAVVFGTLGLAGLLAMGGSTWAVAELGTSGHAHGDQAGMSLARGEEDGHADSATDDHHATTESQRPHPDDDQVHLHSDDSVHVHAAGQGHEHDDGTVHVHLASASSEPAPTSTATESHTHAPGEGHD